MNWGFILWVIFGFARMFIRFTRPFWNFVLGDKWMKELEEKLEGKTTFR